MDIEEIVKEIVKRIAEERKVQGGIHSIVWIGAGGSNGGFYPAQYFMEHESKTIHSQHFTSNEFVMASGPAWGSAYIFSICNIEEMLQIASPTINSCEFFHGPFEILNQNTSLFLLISEGRLRAADKRAVKFLNHYGGEKIYQLDARTLGIEKFPKPVREYFNHILFSPILNNVYMRELSYAIGKDYMTWQYMWKVDY